LDYFLLIPQTNPLSQDAGFLMQKSCSLASAIIQLIFVYVHIGLVADWKSGEPKVLEPEKLESWDWYSLDALPEPMFVACYHAIDAYKTGKVFCDAE
jgi:8-oxo-dGTP diphosphatase